MQHTFIFKVLLDGRLCEREYLSSHWPVVEDWLEYMKSVTTYRTIEVLSIKRR